MPEESESQKFRTAALSTLAELKEIATEARGILREMKAAAEKAAADRARRDDDDD